jgi:hypothetical protein
VLGLYETGTMILYADCYLSVSRRRDPNHHVGHPAVAHGVVDSLLN